MTVANIPGILKARQQKGRGGPEAPSVSPPKCPPRRRAAPSIPTKCRDMHRALFELRYGPLKLYGARWRGYRRGVGFNTRTINSLEERGLVSRWETYGPYRQFQVTLSARALNPAIGE